jgi:hypothetical protein
MARSNFTEDAYRGYWIQGYDCSYTPDHTREYVVIDRQGRRLVTTTTLAVARAEIDRMPKRAGA